MPELISTALSQVSCEKEKGVFLVPTLTTRKGLEASKFPPLIQAKAVAAVKQQDAMVKKALGLGVRIAFV